MKTADHLVTEHIDLWTSAIKSKATTGRGSSKKRELYGIKKLRELILELAVRGKLVPQDPNDEPASMLVEMISREKSLLVKEKKIKRPKVLPEITEAETPFELPNGWSWIRLNDLGEWGAGATPKRGNPEFYGGGIPWFKSGELTADYISSSEETVTQTALDETSLRYNKVGDVLVAMYGATIGKTAILSVRATTNQAVCACTPFCGFSNIYLLTLLKAYKPRFIGMGAGGAQPNISRDKIIATVVALPPEAEQHRIVAKVDELMVLCDQLEQKTETSIDAHATLVETLLATLTNSADDVQDAQVSRKAGEPKATATEFEENWNRIAEHFDTLFTTEHSIDQLKQTILQLAVMGKLVPQDPNDEPASVLLEKIAAEKAQLVKDKKIKKQKALPPIGEDEKPFALPKGWGFARFGSVWRDSFYGPRFGKNEYVNQGGYPTIRTTDMTAEGRIQLNSPPSVLIDDKKLELYGLEKGDLIITRSGSIGTMAVFDLDCIAIPSAYLIRVRLPKLMLSEFTLLMLMSPLGKKYLGINTTSVGVPNVNASRMSEFVFGIPPIEEQRLIVAKVDQLMVFCEQLKERLQNAQQTQLHLADALVEQAVG